MKTNQSFTQIAKTMGLFILTGLMMVSCKKDKKEPVAETSKVALMISSPGATELSFFVDGNKVTTPALTYNSVVPYLGVTAGIKEFSFKKKDVADVLDKVNTAVKGGSSYTIMFADKSPKTAILMVEDDLSAPAADKAKIRFANLSPDAPALDLFVVGKTEALVSKKAFKEISTFINVDPGTDLAFQIKENGKTEVLATLPKFTLEKGRIYTIWARGLKDAAANEPTKLGVEATTNK